MKNMMSGLVPPKDKKNIHYICMDCGHNFTDTRKAIIPLPIRCPECGSRNCIKPAVW